MRCERGQRLAICGIYNSYMYLLYPLVHLHVRTYWCYIHLYAFLSGVYIYSYISHTVVKLCYIHVRLHVFSLAPNTI